MGFGDFWNSIWNPGLFLTHLHRFSVNLVSWRVFEKPSQSSCPPQRLCLRWGHGVRWCLSNLAFWLLADPNLTPVGWQSSWYKKTKQWQPLVQLHVCSSSLFVLWAELLEEEATEKKDMWVKPLCTEGLQPNRRRERERERTDLNIDLHLNLFSLRLPFLPQDSPLLFFFSFLQLHSFFIPFLSCCFPANVFVLMSHGLSKPESAPLFIYKRVELTSSPQPGPHSPSVEMRWGRFNVTLRGLARFVKNIRTAAWSFECVFIDWTVSQRRHQTMTMTVLDCAQRVKNGCRNDGCSRAAHRSQRAEI